MEKVSATTANATACDCTTCARPSCDHRHAFRRLPRENGGLGLCPGHMTADQLIAQASNADRAKQATAQGNALYQLEKNATRQTTTANATTANGYTTMLRAFETAYASGEYTAELLELSTAIARSVAKKLADPQRKTAPKRATVSTSGQSPVMVALRREISADMADLHNLRECTNSATELKYTKAGDIVEKVVDKHARNCADKLSKKTLGDGADLVQTAAMATLEQAQAHAHNGAGWLEMEYTQHRLNRKTLIKLDDSAEWVDETTAPIREIYRAVRKAVMQSRAVSVDPRNGYLYLDELTADPETGDADTVYLRIGKWVDLGGYEHSGHIGAGTDYDRGGRYTADAQTVADYNTILELLNLTDRQAQIIRLRGMGYGYKAIATYLGVKPGAVQTQMLRLREKCEKIGFTPAMWSEMTANI